MFGGATGLLRLFHSEFGGQVSWLLPAALISLAAMAWVSRRAARTDRTRAAALLWGGWADRRGPSRAGHRVRTARRPTGCREAPTASPGVVPAARAAPAEAAGWAATPR
jgi:hypothetical protein